MKKSIFPIIVTIALLTSCKKQNTQPSLSFSDLPFKQGNSWTYSRYDQAVNVRDTVTITIPSVTIRNDSTIYLWVQTANTGNDTAWCIFNNNTLWMQTYNGPIIFFTEIVFPIANGSVWGYQTDISDSSCFVSQSEVNNIYYHNMYLIHYFSPLYQDVPFIQNMYLAKGIGIVRYNQNQSPAASAMYGNLATTNYQWDLLSYHLN